MYALFLFPNQNPDIKYFMTATFIPGNKVTLEVRNIPGILSIVLASQDFTGLNDLLESGYEDATDEDAQLIAESLRFPEYTFASRTKNDTGHSILKPTARGERHEHAKSEKLSSDMRIILVKRGVRTEEEKRA